MAQTTPSSHPTNDIGDPASLSIGKPDGTNLGGPVAVNSTVTLTAVIKDAGGNSIRRQGGHVPGQLERRSWRIDLVDDRDHRFQRTGVGQPNDQRDERKLYRHSFFVGAGKRSFPLTNTTGEPSQIIIIAGNSQSANINSAFATPLRVEVKDVSG